MDKVKSHREVASTWRQESHSAASPPDKQRLQPPSQHPKRCGKAGSPAAIVDISEAIRENALGPCLGP